MDPIIIVAIIIAVTTILATIIVVFGQIMVGVLIEDCMEKFLNKLKELNF